MAYRKLPSFVLFLLAFVAITLSGYQCATQEFPSGRGSIPIDTNPDNYADANVDDDYYYPDDYYSDDLNNEGKYNNRLPTEVNDRCNRSQLRGLSNKYGAMANFEFDSASLEDLKFGASQNFDAVCARLYLDMSQQGSVYKGKLALFLQTASNLEHFTGFNSGYSQNENRYNKWSGSSWRGDRDGNVNRNFNAIFEDEHSAIILKIEDIRIRDVRDGQEAYIGAGELYYKMFRIPEDDNEANNKKGSCYSGTYVRYSHTPPTVRKDRCWFIKFGPFSCRPEGTLHVREAFTNINIATNNYKCFSRLGRFWGLDIEEAFNVSVEDIR